MKKKKIRLAVLIAAVIIVAAGVSVYAMSGYGTQSDPLITKSYLDETLTPALMTELASRLSSAGAASDSGSFDVVTLGYGQTLTGGVGCQIMLRIGSAIVYASDTPGLVDTSSGGTLDSDSYLTENHLYMVTISGHGVTAEADTVKVLVSGEYTVY